MLKATISGISRSIEESERIMDKAKESFKRALALHRQSCAHSAIVEVELPRPLRDGHKDDSGRIRFCLDCGEKEHGMQFGGRYGIKALYRFSRLKAEPRAVLPESALENLLERLHLRARFEEFDEKGAWHAEEN